MVRALLQHINTALLKKKYWYLSEGFDISSHLTLRERIRLFHLAKKNNIKNCLEIGSYLGASAYFISSGLAQIDTGGRLFCIDTWNNDAMSEGKMDTFEEFIKNTSSFADFIIPIRGFSTEVIEQVARQTQHLDLLFIDGDHSYEGVKADWDAYKFFLKSGSVVVFHDWGWAKGVMRVIEEDVKPTVSDFDSLPNMWWGTIRG